MISYQTDPQWFSHISQPRTRRWSKQVTGCPIPNKLRRGPDMYPFAGRRSSAMGTISVEEANLVQMFSKLGRQQKKTAQQFTMLLTSIDSISIGKTKLQRPRSCALWASKPWSPARLWRFGGLLERPGHGRFFVGFPMCKLKTICFRCFSWYSYHIFENPYKIHQFVGLIIYKEYWFWRFLRLQPGVSGDEPCLHFFQCFCHPVKTKVFSHPSASRRDCPMTDSTHGLDEFFFPSMGVNVKPAPP